MKASKKSICLFYIIYEQADRYTPIAPNKKIGKLTGNLAGYKSTDRKQKQWERRYSQLQQMSYSPAGKS